MTVAATAVEVLAAMKEERDALAAELEQERRKADCGAGGIEPCRISPACKTCQIVEVMSHRLAISAELQTARNAIEALGRQLREARERATTAETALNGVIQEVEFVVNEGLFDGQHHADAFRSRVLELADAALKGAGA